MVAPPVSCDLPSRGSVPIGIPWWLQNRDKTSDPLKRAGPQRYGAVHRLRSTRRPLVQGPSQTVTGEMLRQDIVAEQPAGGGLSNAATGSSKADMSEETQASKVTAGCVGTVARQSILLLLFPSVGCVRNHVDRFKEESQ